MGMDLFDDFMENNNSSMNVKSPFNENSLINCSNSNRIPLENQSLNTLNNKPNAHVASSSLDLSINSSQFSTDGSVSGAKRKRTNKWTPKTVGDLSNLSANIIRLQPDDLSKRQGYSISSKLDNEMSSSSYKRYIVAIRAIEDRDDLLISADDLQKDLKSFLGDEWKDTKSGLERYKPEMTKIWNQAMINELFPSN
eukprot:175679_1